MFTFFRYPIGFRVTSLLCMTYTWRQMPAARFTGLITVINNTSVYIDESMEQENVNRSMKLYCYKDWCRYDWWLMILGALREVAEKDFHLITDHSLEFVRLSLRFTSYINVYADRRNNSSCFVGIVERIAGYVYNETFDRCIWELLTVADTTAKRGNEEERNKHLSVIET